MFRGLNMAQRQIIGYGFIGSICVGAIAGGAVGVHHDIDIKSRPPQKPNIWMVILDEGAAKPQGEQPPIASNANSIPTKLYDLSECVEADEIIERLRALRNQEK